MRTSFALIALFAGCHDSKPTLGDDPDAAVEVDAPPDSTALSLYRTTILGDQPIAYWRFSADSPSSALDLVGQAHGTYRGNAAPSATGALTPDPDKAVALDGTGDYVEMGTQFGFEARLPFTIEAWVKPASLAGGIGIIAKDDETNGGNTRKGWHLYSDTAKFGFERNSGTSIQDVQTSPLPTTAWSHVAVTYDGGTLNLYVDGGLRATTSNPNPSLPVTTNPFVIGGRNGGQALYFNGGVDEVAIYDKVLSLSQLVMHRKTALGL